MKIDKSTYFVFLVVVAVMTLSVTVFKGGIPAQTQQQNTNARKLPRYVDNTDRYPVVDAEETLPNDAPKLARLKKRQNRNNGIIFANPNPKTGGVTIAPEPLFNFPGLPVTESDVIVIGQVLDAQAHRSENKKNVFGDYEIRVDEVLKGSGVSGGTTITIERVGGFVKYSDGRKVLFNLMAHGAPAVGARYVFFLNTLDEDYSILTGYELGPSGIAPLDQSQQFFTYAGQNETSFLNTLRDVISKANPR
jgi:hypothetical protein